MLLPWFGRVVNDAYKDVQRAVGLLPPVLVDRIIEAAALVATADGEPENPVSDEEALEIKTVIRQIGNLNRLGLNHALGLFQEESRRLFEEGASRQQLLMDRLKPLAGTEHARLILQVAGSVAAVDGHVSPAEHAMLARMALVLGVEAETAKRPDRAAVSFGS